MAIEIDAGWREDAPGDRRRAFRRRTRRAGVIVVNSGWSTFNLQVLNMSPDGALVQMDGPPLLPEYFELRYDGVKKHARRVWVRGQDVGLAFE